MHRRSTIPQELEDPEDLTVGEAEADLFGQQEAEPGFQEDTEVISPTWVSQLPREVRNLLAGGTAGMVAKTVVAPLERIKILYQVSPAEFHLSNLPKVARNIVHNEGLIALWKGNTPAMVRVFPYSGIQFMVFDRLKMHFLREHQRGNYLTLSSDDPELVRQKYGLTALESLVAGMMAGTVSVICTYPLDLTRAQLAVLKKDKLCPRSQSFVRILLDNYSKRGIQGIFRGISPTLMGILPYAGVAFALNEQGKREIQHIAGRDLTTTERMQCGALAGLVAQTITYPIEVTRRRMQTIGVVGENTALSNVGVNNRRFPNRPPSMTETVRSLYAEQGIRGFFKGVSMNWMKGPIAFSISFTTFDSVQRLMESDAERALRLPR